MSGRRSIIIGAVTSAVALALTACAGQSATPSADGPRTIEVTMTDDLRFDPTAMTVRAGQVVRFVVHNAGQARHEFYLGDEEAQAAHAIEMQEMGGMAHDEPEGISVAPGETKTLEFTFTQPGDFLAGCHEPGHYEAGMVATITVEP